MGLMRSKSFSVLTALAALALAACSTTHDYRVDAVGDSGGAEEAAVATLAPSSGFVVVGGNILLGAPGQRSAASAPAASLQPSLGGSVATVFLTTGQSLLELDDGTNLLVGTIGAIDAPISLDTLSGQVAGLTSTALTPLAGSTGGGLPLVGSSFSRGVLSPASGSAGPGRGVGLPSTSALGNALNPLVPAGTPAVGGIGGRCC
jgi:hypothetical protein